MDKETIGRKLKALRGDRNQEEIAQAIGITVSALSMYENGQRVPRDDVKIRLADFYETPVEQLFYRDSA